MYSPGLRSGDGCGRVLGDLRFDCTSWTAIMVVRSMRFIPFVLAIAARVATNAWAGNQLEDRMCGMDTA